MSEIGTFVAILTAISCWGVALISVGNLSRIAWTAGLIFYLLHIVFAYDAFYGWSHRIAIEKTAAETVKVTGLETGIGLWVNYAFALILALDVMKQWYDGKRHFFPAIDWLVIFMIINGAILFADGFIRAYGVVLIVSVTALRWRRRQLRARGSFSESFSPKS